MAKLKKLIVKKGKERSMTNRHPWIYSGAVHALPTAENGEIVEVLDWQGNRLGYGFYSPENQIICRVFDFSAESIASIDALYWEKKIRNAFVLRKFYIADSDTNAYRLINAEGDFFPGLIADVYDQTVVVQLLIRGTEVIKEAIVTALLNIGFKFIYLKTKEVSQILEGIKSEKAWLSEAGEEKVEIREHGIRFWVDVAKGQKTGFFLDQRDSRALLADYSKGKKVLNTFCYSGGFSMYALRAGAETVDSLDSSKTALELCRQNVELNDFQPEKHRTLAEDCFDYLRKMETDYYDLIVLDPPAFAKNAHSVPQASRGYKDLNLLAFQKIKSGGIVFTFSCSQKIDRDLFRKIVFAAAADAGRNIRILHQTTQPADHPINIFHPENEYLKGLVLYVE
jgi:23S rRNA (cytosine1962-C5)-methyltransferase